MTGLGIHVWTALVVDVVRRHGTSLTAGEILQLWKRYNPNGPVPTEETVKASMVCAVEEERLAWWNTTADGEATVIRRNHEQW